MSIETLNNQLIILQEEKSQALYNLSMSFKREEYGYVSMYAKRLEEIENEVIDIKSDIKRLEENIDSE